MNSILGLIKALIAATIGGIVAGAVSKAGSAENTLGATLTDKINQIQTKINSLDETFDAKISTINTSFSGRVSTALDTFATNLAATAGVTETDWLSKAQTLDKFSLNSVVAQEAIVAAFNAHTPAAFATKELAVGNDGVIALQVKAVPGTDAPKV